MHKKDCFRLHFRTFVEKKKNCIAMQHMFTDITSFSTRHCLHLNANYFMTDALTERLEDFHQSHS